MRSFFLIPCTRHSAFLPLMAFTSFLCIIGSANIFTQTVSAKEHSESSTYPKPIDASVYDLSPLPVLTGNVAQYLPTPRGDVEGLLLTNGTQVLLSPEMGLQVVSYVKPGDNISIRALKGRNLPFVRAFSIVDNHGRRVIESGQPLRHTHHVAVGPDLVTQGTIKQPLYNMQGELNGALLTNGVVVKISPIKALELSRFLKRGQPLYARGTGSVTTLGEAIQAKEVGPSPKQTVNVNNEGSLISGAPAGSAEYDVIPGTNTVP